MRGLSIRARVLLVAILPTLIMALLLPAHFISSRLQDLDESLRSRGRAVANQLASASEYGVFAGNRDVLQSLAVSALRDADLRSVTVYGADRQILARSGALPPGMSEPPIGDSAEWSTDEVLVFSVPILSRGVQLEEFFAQSVVAGPGSEPVGRVVVEVSRRQLLDRKRELLLASLALTAATLVGAVLLAMAMARTLTRPMLRIAATVDAIGRGELNARVEPSGGGSALVRLAAGVNGMASRLQSAHHDMQRRIDEATRQLTDKKEEAEQANLAKSRFLAAASHDLRQPMHALGLFVAELNERAQDPMTRRLAYQIAASADALENLLDALLDISRLDAGVLKPKLTCFPIQPLLDRIEADFGAAARDKGLRLRCRPCGAWVTSDRTLLERILLNLVSNAVRYTERGGVLVGCRVRQERLLIQVADTGIGIPAEARELVFQEFVQLHNPERDRTKGLGLGLAIVQRLSRLLDHGLTLRSASGRGSLFSIDLPRSAPQLAQVPVAAVWDADRWLRGRLVAVIDDDALALASMQGLLETWQCRVVAAKGEDAAMTRLLEQNDRPALVICDYRLGQGRNGVDVIDRFRAAYEVALPGIIVTGDTAADVASQASARGYHVLHKPVRPARLRALMQRILKE